MKDLLERCRAPYRIRARRLDTHVRRLAGFGDLQDLEQAWQGKTGVTMKLPTEHVHYANYSTVILAVMILHANAPIAATNSKLTIVLMSLLILGEAMVRIVRAAKGAS
jgi:hypothetical protein